MSQDHQMHLGDCVEVLASLPPASVDCVVADLPYGAKTKHSWDNLFDVETLWPALERVARPRATFVFTANFHLAAALVAARRKLFKYELVWRKGRATGHLSAKKQPLRNHEYLVVFACGQTFYQPQMREVGYVRAGHGSRAKTHRGIDRTSNWVRVESRVATDRYPVSVVDIPARDTKTVHPTQKPVALIEWIIRTYCPEGGTVLDPTAGAGTTAVAAHRSGRRSICIERDPHYHAAAVARLQAEV